MKKIILFVPIFALILTLGCVERKMLIRSEPAGAPVWLDEKKVGVTPVDVTFEHYGRRRVRVGPMRDEKGHMTYKDSESVVELFAPWYESFPIDFVSEVLWPFKIIDKHKFNFNLEATSKKSDEEVSDSAQNVLEEAKEFRKKSLDSVPEQ